MPTSASWPCGPWRRRSRGQAARSARPRAANGRPASGTAEALSSTVTRGSATAARMAWLRRSGRAPLSTRNTSSSAPTVAGLPRSRAVPAAGRARTGILRAARRSASNPAHRTVLCLCPFPWPDLTVLGGLRPGLWVRRPDPKGRRRLPRSAGPSAPRSRPAVRRLVSDLLATAPPTVRPHLSEFAARIGAPR
jgi:hypothetical protein